MAFSSFEFVQGFEEAVFYSALVEREEIEGLVVIEVFSDGGAEGQVGVLRGGRVLPASRAVFPPVLLVCSESVEELTLYAAGAGESPCEADDAFGEEIFDGVLGVEDVEEALFVGVELLLGLAFDDVVGGC